MYFKGGRFLELNLGRSGNILDGAPDLGLIGNFATAVRPHCHVPCGCFQIVQNNMIIKVSARREQ